MPHKNFYYYLSCVIDLFNKYLLIWGEYYILYLCTYVTYKFEIMNVLQVKYIEN